MKISIAVQTVVFLKAVLLGAALGIIYDLLRAVRREIRAGTGVTAVCDSLFWVVALAALFVFVLTAAAGEGRGYILLGAAIGAALYFLTVSPPVLLAASLAVRGCTALARVPRVMYQTAENTAVRIRKKAALAKKTQKNLKNLFHFFKK